MQVSTEYKSRFICSTNFAHVRPAEHDGEEMYIYIYTIEGTDWEVGIH